MAKFNQSVSFLLLAMSLCGCGSRNSADTPPALQSVFTTHPQSQGEHSSSIHSASVEESRSVSAGFKTGGQIKSLPMKEGSYVSKGQIIGRLDDTDYRLSVKQLETQYNQMTSEMKRLDEMFNRHNIAPNDYEKARAGLEQLTTQLELARRQLDYTRLESPTSGYVVERFMEEGEMVGSGTPVYKIVDNSSLETSVALPASAYSRRNEIVRCVGRTADGTEIPLDIISFVPDADNNSLFRLRLKVANANRKELVPGMSLSVEIFYSTGADAGICLIPSRSLFDRDGKEYVWTLNPSDSTLTARQVEVKGVPADGLSAVTGLSENDVLVAVGVHHLTDNQKVKVAGDIKDLKESVAL